MSCLQFQIFLTELSLDILLFVIGKLDLAGPYLIRSSHILANCCKVVYMCFGLGRVFSCLYLCSDYCLALLKCIEKQLWQVENQSGLNLHCHFYEQQSVTVGRKQSASIFLRYLLGLHGS